MPKGVIKNVGLYPIFTVKTSFATNIISQLQALDTFGNCLRPVFSPDVSKHMHTNKPVKVWAQLFIEFTKE